MGSCFSTKDHRITTPRRVPTIPGVPISVMPNKGPTNKDTSPTLNPNHIDVIYTDEHRKKISLASKLKGNNHFKDKEYLLAIEEYTKAIKVYDIESTYFSNRALCYSLLKKHEEALHDAEKSIQLDARNYKGYHVKGIALAEKGKYDDSNKLIQEGIKTLEKCISIVKENNDTKALKDIETKLDRVRKILYLKQNQTLEAKKTETKSALDRLVSKDTNHSEEYKQKMKDLMNGFIHESQKASKEIPEPLYCKVTFEMMKEPVISVSGISYERQTLYEHLAKVGPFDPSTRQGLHPNGLLPNKQLSEAIQDFQKKYR